MRKYYRWKNCIHLTGNAKQRRIQLRQVKRKYVDKLITRYYSGSYLLI